MSKKATRIVCIILAALMLLGVIAIALPAIRANAVTQAEIDALEAQRDDIRAQQEDIRDQINILNEEMASVRERKAALDLQNELNRQDIILIDEQIALYDRMIKDKALEVENAIASEETQFSRYKARVRAMEESNTSTYISILLQATSLTDFLSRLNDVEDIVRNDQNVRADYVAAREFAQEVQAEYEEIQLQQKEKREELETEKERLEDQILQAQGLIAQLEEDLDAYEQAYDEKEQAKEDIQTRIDEKVAELQKQKEAEEAARRAYEESLRRQQLLQQQQRQQQQQQQQQQQKTNTTPPAGAGSYVWPTGSTYITSRQGYRVHPIFGTTKYHSGADVAAGAGSAILAAAGGTVQISEYSDSYGYYCVIYHSNGITSLYAHMNSMPAVSVGDTVSAGQTIGYVGSTGWATGPHLHFEIRVNGACVDPLAYYPNVSFSYSADA